MKMNNKNQVSLSFSFATVCTNLRQIADTTRVYRKMRMLTELTDLWNQTPRDGGVLVRHPGRREGDDVPTPLDLVHHSISVRQVRSVIHGRLARLANHPINLCMHLF